MSSILTNNSAMVALQTLKSINMNLGKVQSEISTGKTIESAKDNAAVWAISKVMESDVAGFKAISSSLSLGQATVGVALNGAETIEGLLNEMKGTITAAQESNVPRDKLQADIDTLTQQIKSVVGAAQFNGLNLLNGSEAEDTQILSSLDRDSSGNVTASQISVGKQNMTTDKVSIDAASTGFAAAGGSAAQTVGAGGGSVTNTITAPTEAGQSFAIVLSGGAGELAGAEFGTGNTVTDMENIGYVSKEGDTAADVAKGLAAAWDAYKNENNIDRDVLKITANGADLVTTVGDGDALNNLTVAVSSADASDNNKGAGNLAALDALDVTTTVGAQNALDTLEGLIQSTIDTGAELGSTSRQIDTQADFIGKLSDLLTSGVGSLVDADMEAASAKLQALQTQQQLGVQALSIANQAPQTILSLFR